jgi:hypothetical protein
VVSTFEVTPKIHLVGSPDAAVSKVAVDPPFHLPRGCGLDVLPEQVLGCEPVQDGNLGVHQCTVREARPVRRCQALCIGLEGNGRHGAYRL